jgi:uncharacterized protein YpmS
MLAKVKTFTVTGTEFSLEEKINSKLEEVQKEDKFFKVLSTNIVPTRKVFDMQEYMYTCTYYSQNKA